MLAYTEMLSGIRELLHQGGYTMVEAGEDGIVEEAMGTHAGEVWINLRKGDSFVLGDLPDNALQDLLEMFGEREWDSPKDWHPTQG